MKPGSLASPDKLAYLLRPSTGERHLMGAVRGLRRGGKETVRLSVHGFVVPVYFTCQRCICPPERGGAEAAEILIACVGGKTLGSRTCGAVPSIHARPSAGIYSASSESGSPEQMISSVSSPTASPRRICGA